MYVGIVAAPHINLAKLDIDVHTSDIHRNLFSKAPISEMVAIEIYIFDGVTFLQQSTKFLGKFLKGKRNRLENRRK
jgi:hypothetical protein